ncbi:MAG: hypothetical protein AMXMBFR7_11820 [Planctomycetota bacterium]
MPIRFHNLLWFMVLWVGCSGLCACAATLGVGPGQPYGRIMDAYKVAKEGDMIAVLPLPNGQGYRGEELQVKKARIYFKGIKGPDGKRVKIDGKGVDYSGREPHPRAIFQFNPGADGCVLEGFELYDAHNGSHNGAGVRVNAANHVTIRDCEIHTCDMGMMANGDVKTRTMSNLRVEFCHVHHNGNKEDPGLNHNFYLGGTSVTLHGCEVSHPVTGHNVKSRAHHTRVEFCFVHDSLNREFDLVDGHQNTEAPNSDAVLLGNLIVKSPTCDNGTVIQFGQDVGSPHNGTIHVVHNTIVTYSRAPIVELSAPGASAKLFNNIVWQAGPSDKELRISGVRGAIKPEAFSGTHNWMGPRAEFMGGSKLTAEGNHVSAGEAPPFENPAVFDYRLKQAAAPFGAGLALKDLVLPAVPGAPPAGALALKHYVHPLKTEARKIEGEPDLGAFESGAQAGLAVAAAAAAASPGEGTAVAAVTPAAKPEAAPAKPAVDEARQKTQRERWKAQLVARVIEAIQAGAHPRAYLRIFGDKPEAVKLLSADEKTLQLSFNGNKMPWTWAQIRESDLLGLMQVVFDEARAGDHYLLGAFLWMSGRHEPADQHFAQARLAGADGVEEAQEVLRTVFPAAAH